jgi:Tfp pilus assembly protein PilF
LLNLARCEARLGNLDQARERYTESLRLFTQIGSTDGQRSVSRELAALVRTPAATRPRRPRVSRKD